MQLECHQRSWKLAQKCFENIEYGCRGEVFEIKFGVYSNKVVKYFIRTAVVINVRTIELFNLWIWQFNLGLILPRSLQEITHKLTII